MFLQLEEASKKKEPADNRTARGNNLIFDMLAISNP
jgi:hypothetical protein